MDLKLLLMLILYGTICRLWLLRLRLRCLGSLLITRIWLLLFRLWSGLSICFRRVHLRCGLDLCWWTISVRIIRLNGRIVLLLMLGLTLILWKRIGNLRRLRLRSGTSVLLMWEGTLVRLMRLFDWWRPVVSFVLLAVRTRTFAPGTWVVRRRTKGGVMTVYTIGATM